ncbi:MAG: methylmalonyl-CoA epimerase [Ignavibacteria bacterium GWB2_35_12]|nr:MAG: methylmalonyl-CoA epimerase [Ignavibacteria bacterium GWB2_35_12]OGU89762.1 MAG: methylmalonyl-CoA epimerase [Ignavibacteria bacterium RIFOXYA2_FULL_35_10]OGV24019.1 MAG: methylmalonyl-CoA epimerase [Ignavibacteria bacterium RIFOXYC2_FULL_35_21]
MIKSINHIGIAVKDLDASIDIFRKIFSFDEIHREKVESQKVEIASFKVGDVLIELTAATDETSPISKYLEKKGEGIHHIAFETDDVNKELGRLSKEGIQLINQTATEGAHEMQIAFLHPKSTNGVLIELCQKK